MTNHAGDAAQSPIQARKKSATKLEKAGWSWLRLWFNSFMSVLRCIWW
jgi:hypothetical protein